MKVIILRGPSGSGKSTYAARIEAESLDLTCLVVSADKYFIQPDGTYKFDPTQLGNAHGVCLKWFLLGLQQDTDTVIVDNTNCSLVEIAPYLSLSLLPRRIDTKSK